MAGGQANQQRRLIDQLTTSSVDENGPRFHAGKKIRIHHAAGDGQSRNVEGDDVGLREQVIERKQCDVIGQSVGCIHIRIISQNTAVKGLQTPSHSFADRPQTDESHGPALQRQPLQS